MADKRSIYQFASGLGQQNSLLLMDNPDASASSGYTTEKISIGELGAVLGAILYTQLLDTNVKNIFGGINELFARCMNIADDYDETLTYYTGDYVFYQNIFYKCNDDGVTGTWDATKWDITTVADEINELNTGKQDSLTASDISFTVASSSITDVKLKAVKYGNIAMLTGYFRTTASIPDGTTILSGLANPITPSSDGNLYFNLLNETDGTPQRFRINSPYADFKNQGTLASGKTFVGTLTYICQ